MSFSLDRAVLKPLKLVYYVCEELPPSLPDGIGYHSLHVIGVYEGRLRFGPKPSSHGHKCGFWPWLGPTPGHSSRSTRYRSLPEGF